MNPLEVQHLLGKHKASIPETIEAHGKCGLDVENGKLDVIPVCDTEDAASKCALFACNAMCKALPFAYYKVIDSNWLWKTVMKLLLEDPSRLLLMVVFIQFTECLTDPLVPLAALRPKYPLEIRRWSSQAQLTTLIQCDKADITVWLLSLMINKSLSVMKKHGGCIRPIVVIDLCLEGSLSSMPGCISTIRVEKPLHFGVYGTLQNTCTYYAGSSSIGRAPISILDILSKVASDLKEKDLLLSPIYFLTPVIIDSITRRVLLESLKLFSRCKALTITLEKLPKSHLSIGVPECRLNMEDIFPGREKYFEGIERMVKNAAREEYVPSERGCVLEIKDCLLTVVSALTGIEIRLSHYRVRKFHGLIMGVLDGNLRPTKHFAVQGLAKISAVRNRVGYIRVQSTLRKQDLSETVQSLGKLALVYSESLHTEADDPSVL